MLIVTRAPGYSSAYAIKSLPVKFIINLFKLADILQRICVVALKNHSHWVSK